MKKKLVKNYRATLIKWGILGALFELSKEFNEPPTVEDLEKLLKECDKEFPQNPKRTTLEVREFYVAT